MDIYTYYIHIFIFIWYIFVYLCVNMWVFAFLWVGAGSGCCRWSSLRGNNLRVLKKKKKKKVCVSFILCGACWFVDMGKDRRI